jgi:4-amino-4-deoxy-L-arabinose transferase-like glycosyltransferase
LGVSLGFQTEFWVEGYVLSAIILLLLILWEMEVLGSLIQLILGIALAASLGYLWGALADLYRRLCAFFCFLTPFDRRSMD